MDNSLPTKTVIKPESLRTAGPDVLGVAVTAQRLSTLKALQGLQGQQWLGPQLPTVNPPLWEMGHIGWFHERWCLRERSDAAPGPSVQPRADQLYDSTAIAHDRRWTLPLLTRETAGRYLQDVLDQALSQLDGLADNDPRVYFHRLALFHEMMHREAFCYSWQGLAYAPPDDLASPRSLPERRWLEIPAGPVRLGSEPDQGFVFDNEKWAASEPVDAFRISNRVVSCDEYAQFVRDGGYQKPQFWDAGFWRQMQTEGRDGPRYWRRSGDQFQVRRFDRWEDLSGALAMTHVSWHEARAWCAWAGYVLPSEAQWLAACGHESFEWGDAWEWTTSTFAALPGFSADPYKEYSEPWFGTHQVLKGASPATPSGLRDQCFRNFYEPSRNDMFSGFRALIPAR